VEETETEEEPQPIIIIIAALSPYRSFMLGFLLCIS
jgi:hypothetical protein